MFTTFVCDLRATQKEEPGITPSAVVSLTDSIRKCRAASKLAWISKANHRVLTIWTAWTERIASRVDGAS